jgi:hypothetical protein
MKKNSIPLFIGVIVSFIAIWFANDLLLVEQCLDSNGSFNYNKGVCLLENGDVKVSALGNYIIALYFFMGMLISLSVSFFIRKVFNIEQ